MVVAPFEYKMDVEESRRCWYNILTQHEPIKTPEYMRYSDAYDLIHEKIEMRELTIDQGNEIIRKLQTEFFREAVGAADMRRITEGANIVTFTAYFQDELSMMEFRLKWL